MPLLLVLTLLSGAAAARATPPPRAIVLVTIDTLRADHLGCYGYERPTSPFLDRLARDGVVFESAFSSAPHTAPAHASIFTGLYPSQHGVRANGGGFADAKATAGFETLAELAARRGYDTAAVSAVSFLRPILRGFRSADLGGTAQGYRPADATVDAALRYLESRKPGDRFLLWLHLYDPHPPQRAPAPCREAVALGSPEAAARFAGAMIERLGVSGDFYASPAALDRAYTEYDAEIRFADRELERLFSRMRAAGLDAGVLWIVTADHGEGLGNHGYGGHGKHLYNEHLRVPLIVWDGGRRSGRVGALARHVDLLPTVAELLGAEPRTRGFTPPGRSLRGVLDDPRAELPHALALAQRRPKGLKLRDYEPGEVWSVQDLDWKYVVHSQGQDEFFDLRADPFELRNLARGSSAVKERLAARARELFARASSEGGALGAALVDPALDDELRALGYVR